MTQVRIPFEATEAPVPPTMEEAKQELLDLLAERTERIKKRQIDQFFTDEGPARRELYRKHVQFFHAGRDYRERAVFGGNRSGKSVAGAYELTLHLTGDYPHWWKGKRFSRPIQALACGKEAKITRDTVQQVLLGKQGEFGTGLIPADNLNREKCTASRSASGLFDGVPVKHKSGGWSMLRLRSYDQGRTAFEGVERDVIWEDEEAPQDIHSENLMRTMTTGGIVYNTFTPLKGETPLVSDLMKRANEGTVYTTNIWWDDVGHITKAMIDDMKTRYPRHELRARRFGEPQLGTGAIFLDDPDTYTCRPFEVPAYWARLYGLDFGWVHPTAALWLAHDRETDIVYVYSEHRRSKAQPPIHTAAVKSRGEWMTGISETAGTNAADGTRMIKIYRDAGLKLRRVHKGQGAAGGFLESSIMLIQDRLATGRLFIMDNCVMLLEELRRYHRNEKGAVVEKVDDLIAALRYALTGLKHAKTEVESRGSISGDNIQEVNFFDRRRWG